MSFKFPNELIFQIYHSIQVPLQHQQFTPLDKNMFNTLKPGVSVTNSERLLTKSCQQNAWFWLADALASANHDQALC